MEVQEELYNIPSDRLYGVVELNIDMPNVDGETDVETYVTPAASNWLKDVKRIETEDGQTRYFANCLWPRNESKLSSFLEKRVKPADDWLLYKCVRVLKFCRSIGQANEQTKLALKDGTLMDSDVGLRKRMSLPPPRFGFSTSKKQVVSGSDTDDEPLPLKRLKIIEGLHSVNGKNRKRLSNSAESDDDVLGPRKGSKRTGGDLSSDSDSDRNKTRSKSPDPAHMELKGKKNSIFSSDSGNSDKNKPHKSTEVLYPPVGKDNSSITNRKEGDPTSTNMGEKPDDSSENSLEKISESSSVNDKNHQKKPESNDFSLPSSPTMDTPRKKNHNFVRKAASFSPRKVNSSQVSHFTFMREVNELRRSLNSLKITANKIYNCVCPIVEKLTDNDDDRGMPSLPIGSFKDMITWENFLKDHDNTLHVVRLLSERCVLTSVKDSVYNMLKFLLSNKMACSFNVKGKNKANASYQKVAFVGSRSCTAINAALKHYQDQTKKQGNSLNYSTTPLDVNQAISLWLKDAPKRYLNELKHSKTVNPQETSVPEEYLLQVPDDFTFDD